MTYNKKKISEEKQKMIIILLTFLFIFYLIIICIYAYIINNRTILKTDIVTKIDHSVWGGGSGTRYDYSYLKDKDYYLIRGYVVIPSLQVLIERNIIKEGYVITYYVDKNQIEKYRNRSIKKYDPIGVSLDKNGNKGLWYWLTLLSYILKTSFMMIITALLCLAIFTNIPIKNPLCSVTIFYLLFWIFIL